MGGDIRNHHGRGRAIATLLTVICMTAALGACGRGAPGRERVSLVPTSAGAGNVWDWTAACRVTPRTATGCDASGPVLAPLQLAGNEWNLGGEATAGSVNMTVSASGGLEMNGKLSSAPPCTDPACIAPQANTWVRGYPSVLYGIDQCNAKTSPPQSPRLPLPMSVGAIPANLVGSTTYDSRTPQVTYDTAYDVWHSASDTKTPCKADGTLEVMVWTDYNRQSLLPDGSKVGTASIPFSVNGNAETGDQAWSVYANNVFQGGHTQPWGGTVWLILDAAHTVKKGAVSVDLSSALGAVGTVLQNNYGWSNFAGNYWLDTIAFGMEFGPVSADPYGTGPTQFSLNLTAYCLETKTTVSAAEC